MLKWFDPYRWLFVAGFVALVLAGYYWHKNSLIEQGRAEVRTEVSMQALKQIERAQDQTRSWKDDFNAIDAKNQELEADLKKRGAGNAASAKRLRETAPSADTMARTTPETCGANAAEAEADIGWCADRFTALGDTAAAASQKAWELYDKWPEYDRFSRDLESFNTRLKGNQ